LGCILVWMLSGIYRISCPLTGKFYIGSSRDVKVRCLAHRAALRRGRHDNRRLQAAWKSSGGNLLFEFVFACEPDHLLSVEDWFLCHHDPQLNMAPNATAPPRPTPEQARAAGAKGGAVNRERTGRPVSVDGHVYPTIAHAARALNVDKRTIRRAAIRGIRIFGREVHYAEKS
jgi:hypothetical protein